jgi:UDP-glucose 4-epimerase
VKSFVTGAAGFIGSHLTDRLLASGDQVIGWDNFSTGQHAFLAQAKENLDFKLVCGDVLDLSGLTTAMRGCERVFHLAANADVRFGLQYPTRDFEQNTTATFNILQAMQANDIKTIAFSSTGSVYGEAKIIPTPEEAPFPVQTSLYGASKLAGEGLIEAYCEGFGFEAYIFRFVSILGERYTHGHVFDFYRQLLRHPDHLDVLGDGSQRKSYLYINDCIEAMLHAINVDGGRLGAQAVNIYNLGTSEYCHVIDSINWITEYLHVRPHLVFSGGDRGWVGDNPFIFLDTAKIQSTGWQATLTIRDSVIKTLQWLRHNHWVLTKR